MSCKLPALVSFASRLQSRTAHLAKIAVMVVERGILASGN